MPTLHNVRQAQILDVAQELIQLRGYNAFSFGDIAERIGVRAAAVHYHFPTKADLGVALMRRYRTRLHASLNSIDEQVTSPRKKLERYVLLFQATLKPDHRMCLCGMLGTEITTLSDPMRTEVRAFFEDNETWLARVLGDGRRQGSFDFDGSPAAAARIIYSTLQGVMLSARVFEEAGRLPTAGRWLLDAIMPPSMEALLPPR
ncbi:MAG TPA: TetR/AcrR family transcriptional regulator [Tepidisphaeraceae bacterium]